MSHKILCGLRDISLQLKALKAMEILSGEQMRGPRKMCQLK